MIATTQLYDAAKNGDIEKAKKGFANGGNINAKNNNGQAPLHYASQNGHHDVVEFLINKGVHSDVKNNDGFTPLHCASRNGHCRIVELLINSGVDVNTQNIHSLTPLHSASENGHRDVVELLISKSADVNSKNKDGQTPLFYAENIDIMGLLLAHKADVTARDNHGKIAFETKMASSHIPAMITHMVTLTTTCSELVKQENAVLREQLASLQTRMEDEVTRLHHDNNSLRQVMLEQQQDMADLVRAMRSLEATCQDLTDQNAQLMIMAKRCPQ